MEVNGSGTFWDGEPHSSETGHEKGVDEVYQMFPIYPAYCQVIPFKVGITTGYPWIPVVQNLILFLASTGHESTTMRRC